MKTNILRPLFDAGKLWQGSTKTAIEVTDTGFPELNQHFSGHGWPAHMLIEILTDNLLSVPMQCAFATWSRQQDARWIALANPPLSPCTERFMQEGIDPHKVDVLNVSDDQLAWCLEQLAGSQSIRSLIAWEKKPFTSTQLRRLQLACQRGHTQLFLVRSLKHQVQASPAPVRVTMQSLSNGFEITVFKQPGTNARPPLVIPSELHWITKPHPTQRKTSMPQETAGFH